MSGGGYSSPSPVLPAIRIKGVRPEVKRSASPDLGPREVTMNGKEHLFKPC